MTKQNQPLLEKGPKTPQSVGPRAEIQACDGLDLKSSSKSGSTRTQVSPQGQKLPFTVHPGLLGGSQLCVSLGKNHILQTNHYLQLQLPWVKYWPLSFPCFEVWLSQGSCPQVLPSPDLWQKLQRSFTEGLQPKRPRRRGQKRLECRNPSGLGDRERRQPGIPFFDLGHSKMTWSNGALNPELEAKWEDGAFFHLQVEL